MATLVSRGTVGIDALRSVLVRRAEHIEQLARLSIDSKFATDPEGLERTLETERERLIRLERAILTLEASQAVDLVTATEVNVASIRDGVGAAEHALTRAPAAAAAAKNIEHSVLRTSAEIVDERLALLSPLLNELYSRLRPHNDWRSIQYSIRGDVRRFLSLSKFSPVPLLLAAFKGKASSGRAASRSKCVAGESSRPDRG
jgi:chromosome segregation protein